MKRSKPQPAPVEQLALVDAADAALHAGESDGTTSRAGRDSAPCWKCARPTNGRSRVVVVDGVAREVHISCARDLATQQQGASE